MANAVFEIVKAHKKDALLYNGKEGDEFFNSLKNTLIISANNMYVFKKPCVENNFIINYHNALLPRHRGLNAAMWAIYNKDKYSGICWHKVDCGIDTGEILACERIKITDDMDSLELLGLQAKLAISSFKEVFKCIVEQKLQAKPQNKLKASYHSKELPNKARLNLTWKFEKISRFLRSFACVQTAPKIKLNGAWQEVVFYEITKNSIYIKCENSSIRIENE